MMLLLRIALLCLLVSVYAERRRECDQGECRCVNDKDKQIYRGLTFPDSEDYDCKRKPGKCQKMRFNAILGDKSDFLPLCDAKGKFQPKQCIECEPPFYNKCGPVKIQSQNFPNKYIGAPNNGINQLELSNEPQEFIIQFPGLNKAQESSVSLQSSSQPDIMMLRENGKVIFDSKDQGYDMYDAKATFRMVSDKFFPGFVAFQTVGEPALYVRHRDFKFFLDEDNGTDLMHKDASFKIIRSEQPEIEAECWCVNKKKGKELKGTRGDENIICKA